MTVIAQGLSADGDRWELDVVQTPGELLTMVNVESSVGTQGGGCAGPALYSGMRINSYSGSSIPGVAVFLARVAPEVRAVVVLLSDGSREDLVLHGDPDLYGVRIAVLVYARHLDIHRVDLYDGDGAVLPEAC